MVYLPFSQVTTASKPGIKGAETQTFVKQKLTQKRKKDCSLGSKSQSQIVQLLVM